MADDQITPILVAIARLETKVDTLLLDNSELEKRVSVLEHSAAGLGAIKAFLLTVPTLAMGAGVIFTIVRG